MSGQQAVRRTALRETSDARAQNTRSRLIEAYRALMAAGDGPVSALAVCRAAGVARSTFYTYYETIEDLAVGSLADAFTATSSLDVRSRTAHDASSRDITRAGLIRVIGTLEEQRAVILATTRLASRSAIVERLVVEVGKAVRAAIEAEDAALDELTVTTTTEFVAAGTVYASLQWLEQAHRDPQAIVDHLMNLMPPVLITHEARPQL